MTGTRWTLLLLPALAIGALGAGCGGGSEQVTAAQLDQKGDAICREEQAKFKQIQAQPLGNASDAADQTKALIQVVENANADLRGLEPPDALRTPFDIYLSARDRVIDQMKDGEDAAENQDSAGYVADQNEVAKTAPRRKQLADSLGFKVCSSTAGAV